MINFEFKQDDQGMTFSLGVEVSSEAFVRALRDAECRLPDSEIACEELMAARRTLQREALEMLLEGSERLQVSLAKAVLEILEAQRAERS